MGSVGCVPLLWYPCDLAAKSKPPAPSPSPRYDSRRPTAVQVFAQLQAMARHAQAAASQAHALGTSVPCLISRSSTNSDGPSSDGSSSDDNEERDSLVRKEGGHHGGIGPAPQSRISATLSILAGSTHAGNSTTPLSQGLSGFPETSSGSLKSSLLKLGTGVPPGSGAWQYSPLNSINSNTWADDGVKAQGLVLRHSLSAQLQQQASQLTVQSPTAPSSQQPAPGGLPTEGGEGPGPERQSVQVP